MLHKLGKEVDISTACTLVSLPKTPGLQERWKLHMSSIDLLYLIIKELEVFVRVVA